MVVASAIVDGMFGREYDGIVKLAILSDTHVSRLEQLPGRLLDGLSEADLVIHLGDFTGKELLDGLRALGDFRGVAGNMDIPAVRAELPEEAVLDLGGKKVAITHGWGAPWGLRERLAARFEGVDVVLYGHTHRAVQEWVGGVLFFNPGSASGKFPALRKTYGVIDIGESVRGRIVRVD
jgi:putative phosphoesterase